jgi:hypothetical protein
MLFSVHQTPHTLVISLFSEYLEHGDDAGTKRQVRTKAAKRGEGARSHVFLSWDHKGQRTVIRSPHRAPYSYLAIGIAAVQNTAVRPDRERESPMTKIKTVCFFTIGLFFAPHAAHSQFKPEVWKEGWTTVPGVRSSQVATTEGAKLISSTGHSWPDGKQAVVTFWEVGELFLRCIDYFSADMVATGGICSQPPR